MALIPKGSAGIVIDTAGIEMPKTTATAVAIGDVLMRVVASNWLARATSSAEPSDAATGLFAVATSVEVAATTTVRAVPLIYGMLLEADLANNSDTAHNLHRMTLTDHDTLNNSGTDVTTGSGVFMQIAPIGAATDKRALVIYVGGAQQVQGT